MSEALLLDIGNSRVKWARLAGGTLSDHGDCAVAGLTAADLAARLPLPRPPRALAANVAGEAAAIIVAEAVRMEAGPALEFITTGVEACGVSNGYRDPGQLGVDRWLAMIGAWQQLKGPLCVIDCGTAITIDGVDGNGVHIGGMIAPGIEMMRRSLETGTAGVRPVAELGEGDDFGRSTAEAVQAGTACAANTLIDQALERCRRRLGASTQGVITGGAARQLNADVMNNCRHIPDLVLRGLACYAT